MSPDSGINGKSPPKEVFDHQSQLLTVREVSQRLKVSTATVYKLCAEGKLPHVRVSNAIRVRAAAVEAIGEASRP